MSKTNQKSCLNSIYKNNSLNGRTNFNGYIEYGDYNLYTDSYRVMLTKLDLAQSKANINKNFIKSLDNFFKSFETGYRRISVLSSNDIDRFIEQIKERSEKNNYNTLCYDYRETRLNAKYFIAGLKWCKPKRNENVQIWYNENPNMPIKIISPEGEAYIFPIRK